MTDEAPAPSAAPARLAPRAGRVAIGVYLACTAVYGIVAGDRLVTHSPDNHFSYLADSYLHHTLAVRCSPDESRRNACPPGGGGNDWARYENKWYVAFPSFPAVVYMPAVALFGRDFRNRAFDVLLAGIAPACLYLLLERLARKGRSPRSWRENLAFTALYAFGSVYFFIAVQGSVWFTAQVIASAMLAGYLWFGLDAANPLLAGVCLGLAHHCRANVVYAAPFFALEVLRTHRLRDDADDAVRSSVGRVRQLVAGVDWSRALRPLVLFALPVATAVAVTFALNKLRFGEWNEVGYRYLQIRWADRIQRWGLFNYHYLARNLGVSLTSLPWISVRFPFITISLHGIAVWVTTPHYLELPRLRRRASDPYTPFLALSACAIAASVLMYQSTGWIQYGYRYSNDLALFLILLLAINGRKIGKLWLALLVVAFITSGFGALTFDRTFRIRGQQVGFYDNDFSQQRYYQPD